MESVNFDIAAKKSFKSLASGGYLAFKDFLMAVRKYMSNTLGFVEIYQLYSSLCDTNGLADTQYISAMERVAKLMFIELQPEVAKQRLVSLGLPSSRATRRSCFMLTNKFSIEPVQTYLPSLRAVYVGIVNKQYDSDFNFVDISNRNISVDLENMVIFTKAFSICPDIKSEIEVADILKGCSIPELVSSEFLEFDFCGFIEFLACVANSFKSEVELWGDDREFREFADKLSRLFRSVMKIKPSKMDTSIMDPSAPLPSLISDDGAEFYSEEDFDDSEYEDDDDNDDYKERQEQQENNNENSEEASIEKDDTDNKDGDAQVDAEGVATTVKKLNLSATKKKRRENTAARRAMKNTSKLERDADDLLEELLGILPSTALLKAGTEMEPIDMSDVTPQATGENPCLLRELVEPPEVPSIDVESLIQSGFNYQNSSQYDLAVQSFMDAREEWITVTDAELPPDADVFFHNAIGSVYISQGNDYLALSEYMKSRSVGVSLPVDHPDIAVGYCGMGTSVYHLGRVDLALRCFIACRDIRDKILGVDDPDTAIAYNNVAVCLHVSGRPHEAEWFYKTAHRALEYTVGDLHPRTRLLQRNIHLVQKAKLRFKYKGPSLCVEFNRNDHEMIIPGGRFRIDAAHAPLLGGTKKKAGGKKKGGKKRKKK
eukprot:TRINITY_DN773124_c0_g1_i1.p1 TRINITY_DN773124_c0_g1~~TRINITY_DN773124_c0_g1_i1.p1  ORF type:complete len:658 (-),score=186.26 TRINITY_DN773124_c0_g1_i1:209-2182(-)